MVFRQKEILTGCDCCSSCTEDVCSNTQEQIASLSYLLQESLALVFTGSLGHMLLTAKLHKAESAALSDQLQMYPTCAHAYMGIMKSLHYCSLQHCVCV